MNENRGIKIILILLGCVILLAVFIFFGRLSKKSEPIIKASPLASGNQVYKIMTDKPRDPQIAEVSFDPLDAKVGQSQTISVKVKDSKNGPIVQDNYTTAFVKTDHATTTVQLKFIRAESQPELTTFWQGSFTLKDTNNLIYSTKIETKNVSGTDSVDINFR